MKKTGLLFLLIISLFSLNGGNRPYFMGAKSSSMGGLGVAVVDFWSVFNNQSAIAFDNKMMVGVFYENRYLLSSASVAAFAFVLPVQKVGAFSLAMDFNGGSHYGSMQVGLAYSRQFADVFAFSLQFDYLLDYFSDSYYGKRSGFTFEIGLSGKITPNFLLGFHVYNPAHLTMVNYNDIKEYIPTVFKLGVAYQFGKKTMASLEFSKELSTRYQIAAGVEYKVVEQLILRTGVSFPDFKIAFGIGTKLKNIAIDFASSYHFALGYSPQIAFSYTFK